MKSDFFAIALVRSYFSILLAFSLPFCSTSLYGQFFRKKVAGVETYVQEDSIVRYSQSDIFDFPNMGIIEFYYNKKQSHKMFSHVEKGDQYNAYKVMREYVKNFGVENFRKTPGLIWDLARYSKKYGQPGEALQLYKLAIKHYSDGTDTTTLFKEYDSLDRDKVRYYVPMERYQQLVAARQDVDTMIAPRPNAMNMGNEVNSKKADYAPSMGNGDNYLLYTSKRNAHNTIPPRYDEDIFYTEKLFGGWQPAAAFNKINTSFNEGSACLSVDGQLLIFSRCDAPGSLGGCDLYEAKLLPDKTWANIRNLGDKINSAVGTRIRLYQEQVILYFLHPTELMVLVCLTFILLPKTKELAIGVML